MIIKTKPFTSDRIEVISEKINKFIKEENINKIIDIKITSRDNINGSHSYFSSKGMIDALVIYEKEEDIKI